MAKYDDFGRPIYETAEEYNKAHKGGVCPRTYDSPVGENYQQNKRKETHHNQSAAQRHANQTGAKKAKSMVIGIVVFFMVLNAIIIFYMFSMPDGVSEDSNIFNEEWLMPDDEGYGEHIGDNTTPLPEGFETFTYNGQTYTLPESYEELVDEGFMEDGYGFYIDNPMLYDEAETVPDFVFGDGFTFKSTYEDLEAYFGTPYYHYEDHSEPGYYYDSYEWCYDGDYESHYVSVTFLEGVISDVVIDKIVYEE